MPQLRNAVHYVAKRKTLQWADNYNSKQTNLVEVLNQLLKTDNSDYTG